ncbi:MAG: response regulator [Proteobacteria bacterium]|nr:response regulator [Pseudomonadota bacterium]MBI3495932.1 response regulator [Pseudomonadota bacterium]
MGRRVHTDMREYDYAKLQALVIDDDPFFLRLLTQMLEQIGLGRVNQAREGSQGLAEFDLMLPDVVFCDIHMQPIDGMAFLGSVRQMSDPMLAATPIVFVTADATLGAGGAARKYSANGYLVKPFSQVQLKNRLDAIIARSPELSRLLSISPAGVGS